MTTQISSDEIGSLLKRAKTIAVVGLSDSLLRSSYRVSAYLKQCGYRIIPVNPNIQRVLGERAVASLSEINEKIDIVDIFRRPEHVEEVVNQAIKLNVPAIWMQEGLIHEQAAQKARQAGIFVVMDRCMLKEHHKRFSNGHPAGMIVMRGVFRTIVGD